MKKFSPNTCVYLCIHIFDECALEKHVTFVFTIVYEKTGGIPE